VLTAVGHDLIHNFLTTAAEYEPTTRTVVDS